MSLNPHRLWRHLHHLVQHHRSIGTLFQILLVMNQVWDRLRLQRLTRKKKMPSAEIARHTATTTSKLVC
eukprot:5258847-Prorocentrum_lima.AAC.1